MINKRRATIILTLVIALCLSISGAVFCVSAIEPPTYIEVETNIVTPSTYLEYKKLNSPVDVAIDEDRFVIAETNKIVSYIGGVYHEYDLSDYSVSKIAVYGDCCMFLSVSRLYWFDFNDGIVHDTDVNVAAYFSLYGDTLLTDPSNSVFRYTVSYRDKQLDFTSKLTFTGLNTDARKITALDENGIYYFNEGKLINFDYQGAGEKIVENVGEIRYTTSDGESIYFTNAYGVYRINVYNKTFTTVKACTTTEKLFNILNPQGLCYYHGSLYVADATMNTVYSIDLDDNSVTEFAVTDRGDADNRIESAVDVANDGRNVYVLEPTDVKVFDSETNEYYRYSLDGFPGAKYIAANDEYLFLSSGSSPYVVSKDQGGISSVTLNSDVSEYKNITDVYAHENYFYFINNESINSTMRACVYRLDTDTMTVSCIARPVGTGYVITSDIFGNVYTVIHNEYVYEYVVFNHDDAENMTTLFTTDERPKAIFADIESNVFALFDGGEMRQYSFNGSEYALSQTYVIKLSPNLPDTLSVENVSLIDGTDDLYVLTGSCLLKIAPASQLAENVVALSQLPIPEDYKVAVDDTPSFAKVAKGAKLFVVDLPVLNDDGGTDMRHFVNSDYRSELTDDEYVLLAETTRYYLIFNDEISAIIRKEDARVYHPYVTETDAEYYIVDDYGAYCYPVTDAYFRCGTLHVNDVVTAKGSLTFNGVKYAFVDDGETVGYVPETLLKSAVSADNTPLYYYTVKIKKEGAKVYSDAAMTEQTGFIEGGTELFATAEYAAATQIYFEGGTAYIATEDIKPSTYYAIRNIIVVSALFLGLAVTLMYLLVTKIFNKKEER